MPGSTPASDRPLHPVSGSDVPVALRDRQTHPAWPHRQLDVAALRAGGWRPHPFRQFVLKVHSRCNLACVYCYVYRSIDQSWRRQPGRMAAATVTRTATRIAEHVRAHGLADVEVVLHGGEPLLAGTDFLASLATAIRAEVPAATSLRLTVQTNGTLLDRHVLEALARHDIRVGVSVDGPVSVHDSRRPMHRGGGSHADASLALALLRSDAYRHLYAGILAVVEPRTDPVTTYEHLVGHEPPAIDLLLPHANWASPPPSTGTSPTPYGDWLSTVYDRWCEPAVREASVRLFDEIGRSVVGLPSRLETVGLSPAQVVVVETNGEIEHVDALRTSYPGASRTGLNVRDHAFDRALWHPTTVARQLGEGALGDTCRRCDLRPVCGGGYYPHRFREGSGFRHPSVYCRDLELLIRHVIMRLGGSAGR